MPDISMCRNTACSLQEDCYRFTATPNPWRQAYSAFQFYVVDGAAKCDYFFLDNKYEDEYVDSLYRVTVSTNP